MTRNINTCIGIGDLLLYATICYQRNIQNNVIFLLNHEAIKLYRNNSASYAKFMEKFLDILKIKYKWFTGPLQPYVPKDFMNELNITDLSLSNNLFYDLFNLKKTSTPYIPNNYIVIHTKYRICCQNYDLDKIQVLIKNFKSILPIVLLGERSLAKIYEVEVLNIVCLYDILYKYLPKNNTVIDLTTDLNQTDPQIDQFKKDLEIIHDAECNIVFGEGGNLALSCFFSKKNIVYLKTHTDIFTHFPNTTLCKTIDEFTNELNKLTSL